MNCKVLVEHFVLYFFFPQKRRHTISPLSSGLGNVYKRQNQKPQLTTQILKRYKLTTRAKKKL